MKKVKIPTLDEMRERPCSLEELQAKLIDFIDHYNSEMARISNAANLKEDRIWRATI
jgi:hypothetical protein